MDNISGGVGPLQAIKIEFFISSEISRAIFAKLISLTSAIMQGIPTGMRGKAKRYRSSYTS